ncbi:MAG: hypothetical protein KF760_00870 [Candidatus Eremiobacteraeota bacterium]|nr:hypothetical protein [Candidatus Eremiobacteraeota bacterium]
MSELRRRLENELGFLLRESTRPELADFVGPGLVNVRVSDEELLALGRPGREGRAGLAARLSLALEARTLAVDDFRPLWLGLESSLHHGARSRIGRLAVLRTWQGLDRIWEREALAGREQHRRGYPRLAQWALLAGGLEQACKSSA